MSDSNLSSPLSPSPGPAKPRRIYKDQADVKWAVEDHETFELHRRLTPAPARPFMTTPPLMVKRVEKAPRAMPSDARGLTPAERVALGHLFVAEVADLQAAEATLAGLRLTTDSRDRVLIVWERSVGR